MVLKLHTALGLAAAESIADGTLAEGGTRGLLPLAVAVLDTGGHPIVVKRQDGCGILRVDVAVAKAWGSLGMGMPACTIGERMKDNPKFLVALVSASQGRLAPNPGGVLILNGNGEVIGAVGVSGDTGPNDELCAVAAVAAAGLGSQPSQE